MVAGRPCVGQKLFFLFARVPVAEQTAAGFLRRCHEKQLLVMQKIIDAEKSDLFDVLAYVAYALPPLSREERAARARVAISKHFNSKQQAFAWYKAAMHWTVA